MKLLIVDDDQRQRELLCEVFVEKGYGVTVCSDGKEALLLLEGEQFDTVITDLKMPYVSGTEILKASHCHDSEIPVIIITGYGSVDSAIEAMKIGAHDYIQKPFDPEELAFVVKKAVDHYGLIKKNRELAAALHSLQSANIIGSSLSLKRIKLMVERVAPLDVSVLIQGETGTGKELVARLIHSLSNRFEQKIVTINCGALNESLLESELFGHEKGAFTGADHEKKGLFEAASGGTLFLDEVDSMSTSLQVKLLRVLQEGTFMRVGGTKEITSDIRLLSATNTDLKEEVTRGRFREDLYYRLHVMEITIPPLRARKDDIAELAYHFLRQYAEQYKKEITSISSGAITTLSGYDWPGNIRELKNVISRAVIMEEKSVLSESSFPSEIKKRLENIGSGDLPFMKLEKIEQLMVKKALLKTDGNKAKAAQLLGIDASTLWRKMKRWGTPVS